MLLVPNPGYWDALPPFPILKVPDVSVSVPVAVSGNPPSLKMLLVTELPIIKGFDPIFLALLRVTPAPLLLFMITPPVPLNVAGNSGPVVCAIDPLYSKVEADP